MIRIRACLADNVDCLIHRKCLIIYQNSDQLRNDHRRMRIINLDYRMFIHRAQVILLFFHFFQDQLRRIAYHKVLLIDTQQIARLIRIVGI